jgi:Holliday junction DNA helicase RuvA
MISSVAGTVKSTSVNSVVVEVGGIGVLVQVPVRTAASFTSGEKINLNTYLIVREDALTLYGFMDIVDRDFFELLLSVTGVGPKVAQSILSNSDASSIANAVISGNLKLLESVPGLGKKGAQRLVLELKDKVVPFASAGGQKSNSVSHQVENALVGLGYSNKEAALMVNQVLTDATKASLSSAEILKLALKNSGKK